MGKFFVGQPVRIRCPGSDVDGHVTAVKALDVPGYDEYRFIGVQVDVVNTDSRNGQCPFCVFEYHELEPIVPPHEASEYTYTELMDRLKAGEVERV